MKIFRKIGKVLGICALMFCGLVLIAYLNPKLPFLAIDKMLCFESGQCAMNDDWFRCEDVGDCINVKGNCGHYFAVNEKYLTQVKQSLSEKTLNICLMRSVGISKDSGIAKCLENKCSDIYYMPSVHRKL